MPEAPDVTVVIPVRDGASTLGAQLSALAAQDVDRPWEVVVVDNGSTDGTVDVALAHRDTLPLRVVHESRAGINAARNAGVRAAAAERILFCDADDTVRPSWARRMAGVLDDHDAVGSAVDLRPLNLEVGLPRPTLPGEARPVRPPVIDFLPSPIGASCGVRREAWAAVGGFDESYTFGGDEMEFFWRLQVAGFRFHALPEPLVDYRLPATLRDAVRKGFRKGRVSARTYRSFRAAGARFRPGLSALLWGGLLLRSYRLLLGRDERADWLIRAAQSAGRVVGGVEHRILYF